MPEQSLATFPSELRQGWPPCPTTCEASARTRPSTGRRLWARRTCTSWRPHWPGHLADGDAGMLTQDAIRDLPGVAPIWALDVHMPPDGREQFGFKDSISEPAGGETNILGSNPHEAPLKAGEFVLGYEDENGDHLRQPVARRHHRHALHRAGRWPRRTTDQRRRRPADPPTSAAFPTWFPQPRPAGPDDRLRRAGPAIGDHHRRADRGRPPIHQATDGPGYRDVHTNGLPPVPPAWPAEWRRSRSSSTRTGGWWAGTRSPTGSSTRERPALVGNR